MAYVDGQDAARLLAQKGPRGDAGGPRGRHRHRCRLRLDYAHGRARCTATSSRRTSSSAHRMPAGDRRVLLGDFGIGRDLADPAGMTATGMTLGTLACSAPEQLNGDPRRPRRPIRPGRPPRIICSPGAPLFPVTNLVAAISRHPTAAPPKVPPHPELVPGSTTSCQGTIEGSGRPLPQLQRLPARLAAAAAGSAAGRHRTLHPAARSHRLQHHRLLPDLALSRQAPQAPSLGPSRRDSSDRGGGPQPGAMAPLGL